MYCFVDIYIIRIMFVKNGYKMHLHHNLYLVYRIWNWNRIDLDLLWCSSFVMKISSILPFYHEGFIDYGFNQISFFEHLRLRGFRMSLLGNSFLVSSQQEWYDFICLNYVGLYIKKSLIDNQFWEVTLPWKFCIMHWNWSGWLCIRISILFQNVIKHLFTENNKYYTHNVTLGKAN